MTVKGDGGEILGGLWEPELSLGRIRLMALVVVRRVHNRQSIDDGFANRPAKQFNERLHDWDYT